MSLARVTAPDGQTDRPLIQPRGISDEIVVAASTAYDLTLDPQHAAVVLGPTINAAIVEVTTPGTIVFTGYGANDSPDPTLRTWTVAGVGDGRAGVRMTGIDASSTFAGRIALLY